MMTQNDLFRNPMFWVSQIGFFLCALSSLLLMFVYNRHGKKSKPFYYYFVIFLVAIGSAYLVGEPFLYPDKCLTSNARFAWSFAVGVMLTVFLFYSLWGKPHQTGLKVETIQRISYVFGGGLVFGLALMGFLGFRLAIHRSMQIEERYILLKNKRILIGPELQRELARNLKLLKSDSLTISKQTEEIKVLQREQLKNQQEIKELGQANRMLLLKMNTILQRIEFKQEKQNGY